MTTTRHTQCDGARAAARNTCYYPDRRVTSPSRLWILPSQGHRVRAAWRPITSNAPSKA
jgi:hypothetical protein